MWRGKRGKWKINGITRLILLQNGFIMLSHHTCTSLKVLEKWNEYNHAANSISRFFFYFILSFKCRFKAQINRHAGQSGGYYRHPYAHTNCHLVSCHPHIVIPTYSIVFPSSHTPTHGVSKHTHPSHPHIWLRPTCTSSPFQIQIDPKQCDMKKSSTCINKTLMNLMMNQKKQSLTVINQMENIINVSTHYILYFFIQFWEQIFHIYLTIPVCLSLFPQHTCT